MVAHIEPYPGIVGHTPDVELGDVAEPPHAVSESARATTMATTPRLRM